MYELTESEKAEAMSAGFDTILMDITEGLVGSDWITKQFTTTGRRVRCVVDVLAKTVTIKQIFER